MRGLSLGVSLGVSVACAVVGCSADKPGSGGNGRPPTSAGSSSVANGGQSGAFVLGFAGSGGSAASELVVDPHDMMDAGSDAPEEAGVCDDLSIQTYETVPTVVLVVDTSGSMFTPPKPAWDPLFKALMDPTSGVVAMLQGKVRFGFTSYTSTEAKAASCPTLVDTEGDPKLMNLDAIKTKYTSVGVNPDPDGNTPTGPAVVAVTKKLLAFKPEPTGPKFILLVTDGDPDTCTVFNPNCGQDESIKAVQDAYAAGIGTFVIGIGDITNDSKCDASMRTCKLHLQDIANAGAGKPVAPNTQNYTYSNCIAKNGYTDTYAPSVAEGGTAPYYTVSATDGATAQKQIADAIVASLAQTRSCTFNMDAQVKGDASLGTLTFNGNKLTFGDPNGWTLGTDLTSVTLNGTTCDTWKKDGGKVNVNFPCKLVPVVHVDVPPPK